MSSINFDNAYLLLLAIPLVALVVVPFCIAIRKDNANKHNIASGIIHLVMAIIIAFSAAGTTIETTVTETQVYVLADVSYSVGKNLDDIDGYIKELSGNLPNNSKMGVVCFAKEQQLYVPLGKKLKSIKGADTELLDDSETDIESALEFVASLFSDDAIKRVVLMTDGKQSHIGDSNQLKRAVDALRAENVYVDAVFVDSNIPEDTNEVQVMSVSATQNTYVGKPETAEVIIKSTYVTKADVVLSKAGVPISTEKAMLSVGNNTIKFLLSTDEEGQYDYEIKATAQEDENGRNNTITFTQTVSGAARVLLVADDPDARADIEQSYGNQVEIDVYSSGDELPCSIEELCQYDEIVLSDVDLTVNNDCRLFLDNLDTAVSMFGKSLVSYGNNHSQEKEELEALSDMLPIKYGDADRDPKLYAIVIDASNSMDTSSKLIRAKSAAVQLINTLNEGDFLYVAAFNGNFYTRFSLAQVSDKVVEGKEYTSREEAVNAVNSIRAEHGTEIGFGLQQAVAKIVGNTNCSTKQIMLISDGLSFGSDDDDTALAEAKATMRRNRITASVIDIGRGTRTDVTALNAKQRLYNIAKDTEGDYFFASTDKELEDVMFGEGLLDNLSGTIIDDQAHIKILRSSDDVLDGVELDDNNSVFVDGFLCSKAKSGAVTVMALSYDEIVGTVPLYAYWNYGEGRVAVLTTGLQGTNNESWDGAERDKFFNNVFVTNIPEEKMSYPFVAEIFELNGYLDLTLIPAKMDVSAVAEITITETNTEGKQVSTTTDVMAYAASRYVFSYKLGSIGKYNITIKYTNNGKTYTAEFVHDVFRLGEYDSFAVYDISTLYKMIGSDGTVMTGDDNIVVKNEEGLVGTYILDLTATLLIICVVLFVADVIIRKLKWEDIVSLFGKGKQKEEKR